VAFPAINLPCGLGMACGLELFREPLNKKFLTYIATDKLAKGGHQEKNLSIGNSIF
jgi:hypothetical protein